MTLLAQTVVLLRRSGTAAILRRSGRCGIARLSSLRAKDNGNDVLHFAEPVLVDCERNFNPSVQCPVDLEHEAYGCEFDETEPEVTSIPVGIVCLDVAYASIFVLELALYEEVGFHRR